MAGVHHPRPRRHERVRELAAAAEHHPEERPTNHPQTQGKVERLQQTLKRWLAAQAPALTVEALQTQLDIFQTYYNEQRPHRSLQRRTPAEAYTARSKAGPAGTVGGHWRIREDRIDDSGVPTTKVRASWMSRDICPLCLKTSRSSG
ncbi:integrase core domain-containing protein [Lysobacter korlensis]|uniref:Integrase core domain-containing protein n=1 Tax=Lysobacter korlensis TaxID=553636 RepID=A0ABV6S0K2_9GAMM